MNIEQQVQQNRAMLLGLPYHCNFAMVWDPETREHKIRCVFQALERGNWEIIEEKVKTV